MSQNNNPDKPKKKRTLVYYILATLFCAGLILIIPQILIFRKTIIGWFPVTIGWIAIGLIVTPLNRQILKNHFDSEPFFLRLIYNTAAFGGIVIFAFMSINFNYPRDDRANIEAEITNKGISTHHGFCKNPYVEALIKGETKTLGFPCGENVTKYKKVLVTLQKGFFGVDIIADFKGISE